MGVTKIEWADATWNPITGCTPISEECDHCYAARMAKRLAGRCGYPADDPFRVTLHPERLNQPLRWRKPRRIFVVSMGDVFHESVPEDFIWKIIEVAYRAQQHTYLLLTKRPHRMREILTRSCWWNNDTPSNVWLGVTAGNQRRFDERWAILSRIPAAVRWVSAEPLLGDIRFDQHEVKPDWFVVGGETGPGARSMKFKWVRGIRNQCMAAGVPFFFKHWGPRNLGRLLDGRTWDEYPEVAKGEDKSDDR